MTPRLARDQNKNITSRRRVGGNPIVKKRRSTGDLKKRLPAPVPLLAIEAAPSTSWDCVFTSWTTCNVVEMTNAEICTAEFAEGTIFNEDFGNDAFLGECIRLFGVWCWLLEEIELSSDTVTSNTVFENECEEQGTAMYGMLIDEDEAEVSVEPEEQDSHLMAALLSTKDLLPYPSAGAMRALSCPDLLDSSLAALLFETRHLHYINERMALPAPPKWMAALEAIREMDPPNTLSSTVSLPSGWDAVSARLSSSSIFNLFSDRPASPIPSLCNIDPTGAPSTVVSSTVSVPQSFWNTPSTVSVTGSVPGESVVSIPSTFFIPQEVKSSTSSLFQHPSMFGGRCPSSSSASSLFIDPTSAHSSSSIFSVDPSGSSTTSSTTSSLASLISTSASFCSACQIYHGQVSTSTASEESESSDDDSDKSCYSPEEDNISFRADSDDDFAPRRRTEYQVVEMTSSDEESTVSSSSDDEPRARPLYHTESTRSYSLEDDFAALMRFIRSCRCRGRNPLASDDSINTYTVSSASPGYVSDDEPAGVVLQTASTSTPTQTEALNQAEVARMVAECDSILEKLEAMKKKLEELLD